MSWVLLIFAGFSECFWSAMMKLSDGFSKLNYSIAMIVGLTISMAALILATKHLPISLAYPIWTGIGAVGSVLIGALVFKDHMTPLTWFFTATLIISIIGLKIASGK